MSQERRLHRRLHRLNHRGNDRSNVRSHAVRKGLTLLEVLVALAILGIGAAAWGTLAAQGIHSLRMATSREAETQEAAAELARVSLKSATQLAIHGSRAHGRLRVAVRPAMRGLYDVEVRDARTGSLLLRTSFYRRDTGAVAR